MDAQVVRQNLINVLREIQTLSGLACPEITGVTKPAKALEKFDSKMWPVATGMLAGRLGIEIPNDVNIFRVKATKEPATIDEAVIIVCSIANALSLIAAE